MDLCGLIEYWETTPGVTVLVLLGKIKGEHQSRAHMLPCVNVTGSGVDLKLWISSVLGANTLWGLSDGPAFCNKNGLVRSPQSSDKYMHVALTQILELDPVIFPKDIRTGDEIRRVRYHFFRTLRQTSAAQATTMAISTLHTNVINCWSKVKRAGAKQASLPMHQHYAQIEELFPSFKAYMSKM
jgi:hypothetical protein